jgi:isopentenyldiphosphate isomerase
MESTIDKYEVLDEHGHKTGEILDRSTVHKRQLWHEVVNIWVINSKGELLMQLRAPDVELSPSVWDVTVGTHVRPGEAPSDAAIRGLQHELALTTTPDQLNHLFNVQNANPMPNGSIHNVFGHVFLLQAEPDISQLKVDPTKIAELKWVPLNQLMMDIGSEATKGQYFPRASNYYPQLFEAFQAWM